MFITAVVCYILYVVVLADGIRLMVVYWSYKWVILVKLHKGSGDLHIGGYWFTAK